MSNQPFDLNAIYEPKHILYLDDFKARVKSIWKQADEVSLLELSSQVRRVHRHFYNQFVLNSTIEYVTAHIKLSDLVHHFVRNESFETIPDSQWDEITIKENLLERTFTALIPFDRNMLKITHGTSAATRNELTNIAKEAATLAVEQFIVMEKEKL